MHIMGLTCRMIYPKFLDIRFADDIYLFACIAAKSCFLLESLTKELAELGALLNGDETVVFCNEAQPPSHLMDTDGYQTASEKRGRWTQMAWMHPQCREGWKEDFGLQPPMQAASNSHPL